MYAKPYPRSFWQTIPQIKGNGLACYTGPGLLKFVPCSLNKARIKQHSVLTRPIEKAIVVCHFGAFGKFDEFILIAPGLPNEEMKST